MGSCISKCCSHHALPDFFSKQVWIQIRDVTDLQSQNDLKQTVSHIIAAWNCIDTDNDTCTVPLGMTITPSISHETLQLTVVVKLFALEEQRQIGLWPKYIFDCKVQVDVYQDTFLQCQQVTPFTSMDIINIHSMPISINPLDKMFPIDICVRVILCMFGPNAPDLCIDEHLRAKSRQRFATSYIDNALFSVTSSAFIEVDSSHYHDQTDLSTHSQSVVRDMQIVPDAELLHVVLAAYESSIHTEEK